MIIITSDDVQWAVTNDAAFSGADAHVTLHKPATDLLPPDVLLAVARLLGASADKHAAGDFSAGRPWSDDYAALQRHALAFWAGEDTDPHSFELHAIHIAARGLLLAAAVMRWPQHDNRPNVVRPGTGPPAD